MRWLRPSQSLTCPSRSRNDAAGRNTLAYGCRSPSSSDWTTTVATFCSARRASPASGASRSGSTPDQVEDVEFVLGRGAQDVGRVATDGLVITGPQTRLELGALLGDVQPAATGAEGGVHARPQRAVIARAARDPREPGAVRPRGGERRRRRPPRCSPSRAPARTIPRCPAAASAAPAPARSPPAAIAASASTSSPGRTSTCSATSCSRVRRAATTTIRAPRAAALRSRRCRIGTSCSASSPTTTIAAAPSISRYVTASAPAAASTSAVAAVRRPTVVQVVGPQHRARELRQRVGVLVEQAPARDHADARAVARVGDRGQRLAERSGLEPAVAHQRRRDPAGRVVVVEREPPLVAHPGVVDIGVLAREHAHDLAAPLVHANRAPGAAVTADAVDAREVERPRDEPVRASRSARRPGRSARRCPRTAIAGPRRRRSRPAPPRPARRARGTGPR